MKTIGYTLLALLAFAGNSVLCRLALATGDADAMGFTAVRLTSGAVVLMVLLLFRFKNQTKEKLPWSQQLKPALMLLGYALGFSYAYNSLSTGAGALILFASVQITMMVGDLMKGHKPNRFEWLGMVLASSGLLYWLWPLWGQPGLYGLLLMCLSGFCWGVYSLCGQKTKDPIKATALNFILTVPLLMLLLLWQWPNLAMTTKGVLLAITSGAVTSALGYVLWYAVLPKLTSIQAAVLQLTVPILAALGGLLWSQEAITSTLMVATILVFSGVLLSQKK